MRVSRFLMLLLAMTFAAQAHAQRTEIVVYHYQTDQRYAAFKDIIRAFESEHPEIKVTEIQKPDTTITADVQAALAARRPVDIATVIGKNVLYFVTSTPAVAINDDPAKAKFLDDYLPQFLDVGRRGEKIYAMPHAFGTPMLYFNKSLFRQAGLDPDKAPRSWSDVIAAAKQIQERTGIAGVAHLHASNKDYGTMLMVTNAGGRYLSPTGDRLLFDSPEGIAALQLWQDLAVRHKVMPPGNDQQWGAAFLGGRLAMYITSSALLRQSVRVSEGKFELGVANYPRFDERVRRVPNSGAALMLYAPAGPRRDASLKFLAYVSRLEVANQWARESGYMPLIREPLRDPAMRRYVEEFPFVAPVIAQMAETISTDVWVEKGSLEAQSIVSALIDDLWAGKGTAADLVPAAVRRANAALQR